VTRLLAWRLALELSRPNKRGQSSFSRNDLCKSNPALLVSSDCRYLNLTPFLRPRSYVLIR